MTHEEYNQMNMAAYQEGWDAAKDGLRMSDNPYEIVCEQASWFNGFTEWLDMIDNRVEKKMQRK